MRKAVREHVKHGVDFIKLFATGGNTTPGSNSLISQYNEVELCAATEEARKASRRTAAHAHGLEGVRNAIRARVTTIEHCSFQGPKGLGWDPELVCEIVEQDIYVCHTVFQGITKLQHDPQFEPTPAEQVAIARRRERLDLTRKLYDHGVKLLAGNDAGVAYCEFADFPGDLALTCEGCGIPALAVLKSATSVAAEALGRQDIGAIAVGKRADLLVVAGDPLHDINDLANMRAVIARGKVVHGGW